MRELYGAIQKLPEDCLFAQCRSLGPLLSNDVCYLKHSHIHTMHLLSPLGCC